MEIKIYENHSFSKMTIVVIIIASPQGPTEDLRCAIMVEGWKKKHTLLVYIPAK